ncbi:phosphoribosylglycinamide formyltransferase [Thermohalobaculum xanthum]|uniref:phosphoribosylglycinamide formyltransferase n=1 Tax=Thermohalobaculum xanthum TaxID=2753746 RepID=UPI002D80E58A|nr:phosphoribosylglycinamide formyltransferase [Thermohalobaculum xanthum]
MSLARALPRVGILISGSGSNMVALLEAMRDGRVAGTPAIVVSNNPDAAGLAKAHALGVATAAIDHRPFKGDRAAFDAEVDRALREAGTDVVACAGFMRIMTDDMIGRWTGRMVNIHPSVLPLFKGLHTHQRALDEGMAVHGCTVHEVTPELDTGTILGQAVVPVRPGDTAGTLAARVLRQEHRLYPRCLDAFLRDPEAARREKIAILADEE